MIDKGFFEMADAAKVLELSTDRAKDYCFGKIDEYVGLHPATKMSNIMKANSFVHKAKTTRDLSLAIANFVLAHPSEDLAVM
jgi:hypothetical protein